MKHHKKCGLCLITKPRSDFSLHRGNKTDGLQGRCKECATNARRAYIYPVTLDSRECTKCRTVKERAAFNRCRTIRGGLSSCCRECKKEQPRNRWLALTDNAQARRLVVEITKEYHDTLTAMPCTYCGASPNPFSGIDRYNNAEGYTESNCVPCCTPCNRAKLASTAEEYISRCIRVAITAQALSAETL